MEQFIDSSIWCAIILGIIEGVTEFLPISSTGHLIIAEHWLGSRSELFNVLIQSGAVLAVLLIYWERLKSFLFGWHDVKTRDYMIKLVVAFILTGVGGLVLKFFGLKLTENLTPVALAVLVGGVAMWGAELFLKQHQGRDEIGWDVVFWVAFAQLVAAAFPGTSRSAATIIAAMFAGVSRVRATEFSFLVGIPTLLSAGLYSLYKERNNLAGILPAEKVDLMVAFLASTITAFFVVRWLLRYIQSNDFRYFAYYRIVLGIGLLIWAV